jgi:integrase
MELTDKAIRNAKPTEKPHKLSAGRGLYLLLNPNGARWWRFNYRWQGKQKQLSVGVYPEITLAKARQRRDELRALLADGIDPGERRKAEKAARGGADSFEAVAREWYAKQAPTWAPSHAQEVKRRMERNLYPYLGARLVGEITAPELLAVLRRAEARGAVETAHRMLWKAGQVFRYAVATGRAERDPSGDLRGALPPRNPEHYAAITKPAEVGELMRAIDGYQGEPVTRAALKLLPLVFVRPGELRRAEWAEFDLDAAEWNIPAARMKRRKPHLVPLSTQAVAILRGLQPLTDAGRYVFPGARSAARPMSENAINAALRNMGITKDRMTGHAFRAMARTLLDEALGFRVDFIEHQLAHNVRDPLGTAYNRTKHLPERRRMMQAWADYLDSLKRGGNVVALHAGRGS